MEIIKCCLKHGDLTIDKIIKSGKNKLGHQAYKCKMCMKDFHKNNYEKNKNKVLLAHKKYREENPQKYRDSKNASKRKMYRMNKKKYNEKSLERDRKNPVAKSLRQKRFKDKTVQELKDSYINRFNFCSDCGDKINES